MISAIPKSGYRRRKSQGQILLRYSSTHLLTSWDLDHVFKAKIFISPNSLLGKFSLKCYRLFEELYEPFFEGAKRHFAKRKQASS